MYEKKYQLAHNDKDAPYKHVKEGQSLTRMLEHMSNVILKMKTFWELIKKQGEGSLKISLLI
jgi:hypothetical protein